MASEGGVDAALRALIEEIGAPGSPDDRAAAARRFQARVAAVPAADRAAASPAACESLAGALASPGAELAALVAVAELSPDAGGGSDAPPRVPAPLLTPAAVAAAAAWAGAAGGGGGPDPPAPPRPAAAAAAPADGGEEPGAKRPKADGGAASGGDGGGAGLEARALEGALQLALAAVVAATEQAPEAFAPELPTALVRAPGFLLALVRLSAGPAAAAAPADGAAAAAAAPPPALAPALPRAVLVALMDAADIGGTLSKPKYALWRAFDSGLLGEEDSGRPGPEVAAALALVRACWPAARAVPSPLPPAAAAAAAAAAGRPGGGAGCWLMRLAARLSAREDGANGLRKAPDVVDTCGAALRAAPDGTFDAAAVHDAVEALKHLFLEHEEVSPLPALRACDGPALLDALLGAGAAAGGVAAAEDRQGALSVVQRLSLAELAEGDGRPPTLEAVASAPAALVAALAPPPGGAPYGSLAEGLAARNAAALARLLSWRPAPAGPAARAALRAAGAPAAIAAAMAAAPDPDGRRPVWQVPVELAGAALAVLAPDVAAAAPGAAAAPPADAAEAALWDSAWEAVCLGLRQPGLGMIAAEPLQQVCDGAPRALGALPPRQLAAFAAVAKEAAGCVAHACAKPSLDALRAAAAAAAEAAGGAAPGEWAAAAAAAAPQGGGGGGGGATLEAARAALGFLARTAPGEETRREAAAALALLDAPAQDKENGAPAVPQGR
ncbi:hypothetical protein Rsub_11701 [Raphidocelis subcapitata]|uniref:Uncharacterized protein n=1 Tax=Raphidocelis subcapitata TaxID=307507 RepID=A0A2V0PF64_9CHLO|nr:hypothetical protein Rsub_11701 [Raphidocelis subcapitata]|eukprot:GBF98491.1 hypothetical protein Rsub_11701 [Raphidocelis subcapitata]